MKDSQREGRIHQRRKRREKRPRSTLDKRFLLRRQRRFLPEIQQPLTTAKLPFEKDLSDDCADVPLLLLTTAPETSCAELFVRRPSDGWRRNVPNLKDAASFLR